MALKLKTREQTRNVSSLTLRAEVGTVDGEKRTVDMTFSTGARVYRQGWFDDGSFEELSMDPAHVRMGRLQSGSAPFLADHYGSTSSVLGVISSARIEGGKGIATVRFPKAGIDERADQVFEKIKDGILRNVSVGYRTHRSEKNGTALAGKTDVPVFRAVDWEPFEVSAVAIPADASATFRSAEQSNPCVFVTQVEGANVDEEEKKRLEAEALAKREEEKRARELKEAEERGAKAEQARVRARAERDAGIRASLKLAKLDGDEALSKRLLDDEKVDLAHARDEIFAELSKRQTDISPHVSIGETDREKFVRGATAGMLTRAGGMPIVMAAMAAIKGGKVVAPGVRKALKDFDPDEDGGEFRGYTLKDLGCEVLERAGVRTRGWSAERVFTELQTRAVGSNTISDFAVALENVMYKTLLGQYAITDDTWRRFCGTDTVQDFRASNRYRLGSFGTLDTPAEGAELKNVSIPDAVKFSITTETRGNMIAISRQALINDDMGAIAAQAGTFGRMAALSIEKAVYALLAQNSGLGPSVTVNGNTADFFDASFGNVGAGAALSVTALEANRVLMAQQQDPSSNEYLDVKPSILLVPVGLGGEAKLINRATNDPTVTTGNPTNRPNIVAGLFRDIIDTPRLSGTRRYLFAEPGVIPAIIVAFLNGEQSPYMEQKLGWRVDGLEWKLRHDFKAQMFDPKGALTDAGA